MSKNARYWIDKLQLHPHPEGGYYRQTYRADLSLGRDALPPGFAGNRAVSTGIYFLLDGKNFSAFHRLKSDEMWHFYAGCAVLVHVIQDNGEYSEIRVGDDLDEGQTPQAVVKAGCWFGSQLMDAHSYALVGCTVSPGFDFEDFELAKRQDLVRLYPQHRQLIEKFTRE